jgi:hypothetical protein
VHRSTELPVFSLASRFVPVYGVPTSPGRAGRLMGDWMARQLHDDIAHQTLQLEQPTADREWRERIRARQHEREREALRRACRLAAGLMLATLRDGDVDGADLDRLEATFAEEARSAALARLDARGVRFATAYRVVQGGYKLVSAARDGLADYAAQQVLDQAIGSLCRAVVPRPRPAAGGPRPWTLDLARHAIVFYATTRPPWPSTLEAPFCLPIAGPRYLCRQSWLIEPAMDRS